jgi:hypothetical protein
MIPRTNNMRANGLISDEWIIESEEVINNHNLNYTTEDDEQEQEQEEDESLDFRDFNSIDNEYLFLREKINELCENDYIQSLDLHNKDTDIMIEKECIYSGISVLKNNLDEYLYHCNKIENTPIIHICGYQISKLNNHPYLEFLMNTHSTYHNTLCFPQFTYSSFSSSDFVITQSSVYLKQLSIFQHKLIDVYYKGYTHDNNNNIYLFFNILGLDMIGSKKSKKDDIWLVTVEEIEHSGAICDYKIDEALTIFFRNNNKLLELRDIEGRFYETPSVVYNYCPLNKVDFVTMFGVPPSSNDAMFGRYYYFTDYKNAVKNAYWLEDKRKNEKSVILRCLILLGKLNVKMNYPNDTVDASVITQDMLQKASESNHTEYQKIKMLMRVSDRDGIWTKEYNSVFVGNIELDDGSLFENYPLTVVKEYEHHMVYTSHIVDASKLGDKWSREQEFATL